MLPQLKNFFSAFEKLDYFLKNFEILKFLKWSWNDWDKFEIIWTIRKPVNVQSLIWLNEHDAARGAMGVLAHG